MEEGGSSEDKEIYFEDLGLQDQLINWMQGVTKTTEVKCGYKVFDLNN